jgi:hypothetical protein
MIWVLSFFCFSRKDIKVRYTAVVYRNQQGCVPISDFSANLTAMGFIQGDVIEVLLSTISAEDVPNVAPMGVWVQEGPRLIIRPYQDTQTARNIENNGNAILNLSQDPNLFLSFAFKEELHQIQQAEFDKAKKVKAPRIRGVSGFIEVIAAPVQTAQLAAPFKEFECTIQHIDLASSFPIVFSRSRSAAIECVIYATKIRALHRTDPITTKLMTQQIDERHDLVKRIAPKTPAAEVIHKVESLLPLWMK